jgi:putative cell wall-binding protein
MRSSRLRSIVAATVAMLLLGTGTAAAATVDLQRLEGGDRITTAIAVAMAGFPGGASTAVLARADDFPDAMTAAALAGAHGGPVLLTPANSIPSELHHAMKDLGVGHVVLVGGTAAISASVEAHLARSRKVTRVYGNDRYSTAAAIATEVARVAGVGTLAGKRTVFVADGDSFPDALASGAIAFKGRHPILLTRSGGLPAPTAAAVSGLGVKHAIVLGGASAVSDGVVRTLNALGVTTERVGGSTRTQTAASIADLAISRFGLSASKPFLVRGDAFADALVAGPAAGKLGGPILLTASPTRASGPTQQWFADRCEQVKTIVAVGGEGAISAGAASAARQAAIECEVVGAHGVAGTAVDASTTGPTAYFDPALGRRLTYGDLKPSGGITTTKHGQVIQKLDVTGQIRIAHDNVTVRAVRIRNNSTASQNYSISYMQGSGAKGAKIEYVEIDGRDAPETIGVVLGNFTMRHAHIYGHRSGVHFSSNSTIEHSYVHSQVVTPGSHNTAMAIHGGQNAVVRGNNLVGSTSSALSLYANLSPVQDILIEQNLFNGGAYCTIGGSGPKPFASQTERVRYLDNVFGQSEYDRCGQFGPVMVFSTSQPGNEWSGNVWERSGATVPPS